MTEKRVEVIFAPAEYAALGARDLSETVCVVFDILRATTTMLTALANGAAEIIPVSEITEALALRAKDSNLLLAGERGGLRIRAEQTGSVDFDFGNSPREFTQEKVRGKRIAITTTNGTRALRACAHGAEIFIGSFLNMSALAKIVSDSARPNILIVCAGTHDEASMEDTLAAGLLAQSIPSVHLRDSAQIAAATFSQYQNDLFAAVSKARNGRKLQSIPDLAADIPVCFQSDTLGLTAQMDKAGVIRARA